jgi:hypothetical protein
MRTMDIPFSTSIDPLTRGGEDVIGVELVDQGKEVVEVLDVGERTDKVGIVDVWTGEGIRLDVTVELYGGVVVGLQAVNNKEINRRKLRTTKINLFILIPFTISKFQEVTVPMLPLSKVPGDGYNIFLFKLTSPVHNETYFNL